MYKNLILLVLLQILVLPCIYSIDEDFVEDDVVIEEEIDTLGIDVPYESPKVTGVYLAEHFDDENKFNKKWVKSEAKKEDISEEIAKYDGVWKLEPPVKDGLAGDLGLVLKSKAKHAAISAKLDKPFVFNSKTLMIQYEVLLQEGQECGGAYLKLLTEGPATADLRYFHDKTPYTIMFGPDKCGNDHKLHFIFRHRNPLNGTMEEKHCNKPKERLDDYFRDKIPHLYTLILKADNSFEIWVDEKIINSGSLLEDFTPSVNPPAEIDDPQDKKPEDWDEREKIPDPDAVKPDDWDETAPPNIIDKLAVKPEGWLDDEEPMIPDPQAVQPEDWDSEMDGEWEPPLIDNPRCAAAEGCGQWKAPVITNPEYKGKWRAPLIDNPNYKGKWKPRRIANPDYFEDLHPFQMPTITAVGFELWSMSQDILFDNIIITDDPMVLNKWTSETFQLKRRKIAKDAISLWGRAMKAMNYKPGWWALYFVYCMIPLVIYIAYLRKCVKEEEKEENEKLENDVATIKKTDAETKDDEHKSDEEVEEKSVDDSKEDKQDEENPTENINEEKEEFVLDGQGDVPRKRKVRKD